MPSFLTRVVLCAEKQAWKRRPFLLSSQICSNYRITSICGSLAAFSLPPPPLSSPVFSRFPSPLSFICIFPYSSFFLLSFFWLRLVNPERFLCAQNHSLNKVYDNQNILAFLANGCSFGDSIRPRLPKKM